MQEFTALANRLADAAGEIARDYFRQPFDVEHKADETPVTIADRAIEQRMREIIEAERPDDGILGEEFGVKDSANGLSWVLDPIDGTKPFITGKPTFGTLIALCEDDVPALGVIDQPIVRDRWVGARGMETTHNGAAVRTAPCPDLTQAKCASTGPAMFEVVHPGFTARWRDSVDFIVWGGDCVSYGLLANGWIDLVIEAELQPYDFAALVPVVEGAGGIMRDWDGGALTLKSDGRVVALGDPSLWKAAQGLLP